MQGTQFQAISHDRDGVRGRHGFTLMEMLLVVAIIAVLVAIVIPTFTSALACAR